MAEPVVVTIPHKLTKEEAVRRLKKGFGDVVEAGAAEAEIVEIS